MVEQLNSETYIQGGSNMEMDYIYTTPFSYKLIYVFEIPDGNHDGALKVGEATLTTHKSISELVPNCSDLNQAAIKRIKDYTKTASIQFKLLHTELAVYETTNKDGERVLKAFSDHAVHKVLDNSGVERFVPFEESGKEWFLINLPTVKDAIKAVKDGKPNLGTNVSLNPHIVIEYRPEQKDAISRTIAQFKKHSRMLWNAKMRFGKTLSALEVVRQSRYEKTIIVTHRPVVDAGWFEDYSKVFSEDDEYEYGSKGNGSSIEYLLSSGKKFIYFASIQDLRGSELVGGKHDKNEKVFDINWDLVIVDEAHEGTTTALGDDVIKHLVKPDVEKSAKFLALSGTPFNIIGNYDDDSVYTWDYIMEQERKAKWDVEHFGDSNPYSDLPKLNIYTFDLGEMIGRKYIDIEDKAFNFKEFFRTWTDNVKKDHATMPSDKCIGDFVHEDDIRSFLNLISTYDEHSNYPYSTEEFRNMFQHSLWMVPGVKEAKALSKLMGEHPVFGNGLFEIVNVAGEGDEDVEKNDALVMVNDAIRRAKENYTITISCGRLTTGVSIPEWTAVFMLAGSYSTSPANYLQTIFRVQTPCNRNGKVKQEAYVFDFAPDRTLKMVASAATISTKAGKTDANDKVILGSFLNYCPIVSVSGTQMKLYNVNSMLQQLKRAYAERTVANGFDDTCLYNDELLHLEEKEIAEFKNLEGILEKTKATKNLQNITINDLGFDKEQYDDIERINKKPKKERTPEELAQLEKLKEQKKQRKNAISILRGVSIRIPLLIYGAEVPVEEDISLGKLVDVVDNSSWEEFMPFGVTKEIFKSFIKYYDEEVFIAAGRKIRNIVESADQLAVTERIAKITGMFNCFKNPDKETVLTPWKVVNLHMSDTLGGYDFYDDSHEQPIDQPRYVDRGKPSIDLFNNEKVKVLEINSKTGLYPLYLAYSVYRYRRSKIKGELSSEKDWLLWQSVLSENIFVVCKTNMAKSITKRTLLGYRVGSINAHHFDDLINKFQNKSDLFISKVTNPQYWKKEGKRMNFDAIVGNPPYQIMDGGNKASAKPVYHYFVNHSKKMNPQYISMIMPSRWFIGGKGLDKFRENMLKDECLEAIYDYPDYRDVFPSVDLAGGVCYLLWNKDHSGQCKLYNVSGKDVNCMDRNLDEYDILVRDNKSIDIVRKVVKATEDLNRLNDRISARKPFGMSTDYKPKKKGVPCWFIQKYGRQFADAKDVRDPNGYLDKWKLLIPITPIAGQTDFTKPVGFYYDGNIFIAKPGECCTESFVVCGAFDTEEEVKSFKSYILTKTVRFLLLQSVISQHVTQKEFRFVPDLGSYSGVYTDEQLVKLWGITEKEWNYIDSRISNIGK